MRDIVKGIVNGIVGLGHWLRRGHKFRASLNLRTDTNDYSKENAKDRHLRSFRVRIPAALRVKQPSFWVRRGAIFAQWN